MRRVHVTTWNVLHRVHAVNWKEPPALAFPDERVRIAGISELVARWLVSDVSVVCLQEVSGDQLSSLRQRIGNGAAIHEHLYPRVPRVRGNGTTDLDDPTEHLVTIVKGLSSRELDAQTFESDPGKGLLAIDIGDDTAVINTHVSARERRDPQLGVLAEVTRTTARAIVLGDFNAEADIVRPALGDHAVISDLAGQPVTRIAAEGHGGKTIDHVLVLHGTLASATVLDCDGLSDHNPVTAMVLFDPRARRSRVTTGR